MWFRSYRDHVVMALPSFDTATKLWAPQANITWVVGPARKSEFVRFAKRVMTEGDAVAWALNASRAWIDQRLKTRDTQAQRQAGIEAPSRLKHVTSPVRAPRSATRTLTFAQFKSLMGKSAVNASEQSLQKSYTALIQLRKHSHRSWAQIKFRMKHSRQYTGAGRPMAARRETAARLPLTVRDWRRII